MPSIEKICVLGAGNMGHQIALSAALAGYQVKCMDVDAKTLDNAKNFVEKYLPERVAKGKLDEESANMARTGLSFTEDLKIAAGDADFVIEAVLEKLDLKRKIFLELDKICQAHTILTTNSSYIVSSKIADITGRPGKICNMHFFNPALAMKLVEVVKGPHVSDETAEITMELSRRLEKKPVLLKKEIYGFLVNRILEAINKEALFLLDQGIANAEDIDTAVVNALGHPMGPFTLMDFSGIDLLYHIFMEHYHESQNPADKPSPSIVEKYALGEFDRKTGKGFYDYSK